MANKRPTEASWDSDDELLGDDMAGISAFPVEKDEELDEDALLGASDDETDMAVTDSDILDTSHEPEMAFQEQHALEEHQTDENLVATYHTDELGGEEEEELIELEVEEFEEFFDEGHEEESMEGSAVLPESSRATNNSHLQAEDEGETTGMEESFADTTQDTEGGGGDGSESESEESEDEDSRRGKFKSERTTAVAVTKTQRPITDIPDTLEVSQEDQAKIEQFLQKKPTPKRMGRGGHNQQSNTRFPRPMGRGGPRQRNMNMQRFPQPQPRGFMGNQRLRQISPRHPRQITPRQPRQITPRQPRQITPRQPRQITQQQPRKILINPHFRGTVAVQPVLPWGAGNRMPGSGQNFQPRGPAVMFGQQGQNQQVISHNVQAFQPRPAETLMHQSRPLLQQPPMQAWGAQQQQHQQHLQQQQLHHQQQQQQQQQQQGGFMQQGQIRSSPVQQPQAIIQQRGVRPMFEGINRMPAMEHQMPQRAPQNMNMGPRQNHPQVNKPRLNVPASQQYQPVNQQRSITSASQARSQASTGPRFQDSRIVNAGQADFQGKIQNPNPGSHQKQRFPNSQPFTTKQASPPTFRAPRPVHTEPTHPVVKRHLTPIPKHEPYEFDDQNQAPQTTPLASEGEEVQRIQSLVSPTPTVLRVKSSPSQDMDRLLARKQRFDRSPKLTTPTKTALKRLSSQSSSDADPSPLRAAKVVKTTASGNVSLVVDDDSDLRNKLEEQKRLRLRLIEQKELRRRQTANKRRAEIQGKIGQQGTMETSQMQSQDESTQQQSIAVHTGSMSQAPVTQGSLSGTAKPVAGQGKRKVVNARVSQAQYNAMLEAQNPGGKVFSAQTVRPGKSPARQLGASQRGGLRLNTPGQPRLNKFQSLNRKPNVAFNQARFQARGRGQILRGRGAVARGRGQIGRGMIGRGNVRPNQNIQSGPGPNRLGNMEQHFTNPHQQSGPGQGPAQNMPGDFRQNSGPVGQQMTPDQFRMTSPHMQGNAGRKVIAGNRNGPHRPDMPNNRPILSNRQQADWPFNPELKDRKVIMTGGGDHPPNPVGVRIDGIPASTSEKTVYDLAQQIGPIDGVHLITAERRAVVTFRFGDHAVLFARRFNRHMLDLSMITVSVLQS